MAEVAATDFTRNFGMYRDIAQREPVAVKSHARVIGYFVSPHEFDEYQQLKAQARVALSIDEFSEDMIEALRNTRMDPRHDHLNAAMDERAATARDR